MTTHPPAVSPAPAPPQKPMVRPKAPSGGPPRPPPKAAIQTDARSTDGARNKNNTLTRVVGAAAFMTYAELAKCMQVQHGVEHDQKKRFAHAFRHRVPLIDQEAGIDVDGQCESVYFHRTFEYK